MTIDQKFIEELNIFKNEILSAQNFLYTELAIHAVASKNKKILRTLNYSPIFWNTVFNALQHSTFITLGRIFDTDSNKHTIHTLLNVVENNKSLFTKKSFEDRWKKNGDRSKINHWLPEYLKNVYVPTDGEYRKFRKYIKQQKKIYNNIYAPVRIHFAHKIYSNNEEVKGFFDKIIVKDLEKFCVSLNGIHESLWQLYHNGHGPLLPIRKGKYSTQSILKTKYKKYGPKLDNVQIVKEVQSVLNLLKNGSIHILGNS